MGRVDITYNARVCQFYIPSGKVNISVDSCSTRWNCITHSHHDVSHHMRTIYNRQQIYAVVVEKSFVLTTPRGKPAGVPMIAFYQHPYTARALG